jgi:hypothetical protein
MATRVLATALAVILAAGAAAAETVKEIRKTLPLDSAGRVSIDTYKGTLRIETWDRSEVEIHARIVPDSGLFDGGELVQATEVRIEAAPAALWIKSDYTRAKERGAGVLGFFFTSNSNLPEVHYRIRMPKRAQLRVKDYRSESWLGPVAGGLEYETYRGRVAAFGLEGPLIFKSYRGEAEFRLAGLGARIRLETYRGNLRLTLPRGRGFRIETDLGRHADLDSDFELPAVSRDRHWKDYRGAVNGGGPEIFIKSYRGGIRLRRGT